MGYLRRHCCRCGQQIYMKRDPDGRWRPYKSWVAGHVDEGTWELHQCGLTSGSTQQTQGPTKVVVHATIDPADPRTKLAMEFVSTYKLPLADAMTIIDKVETMVMEIEMEISALGEDFSPDF